MELISKAKFLEEEPFRNCSLPQHWCPFLDFDSDKEHSGTLSGFREQWPN